jgi:hypothetical protein
MPQIQLTITLDDNGAINVNGPIDNPLVCYGLLVMAKDAIAAHIANQARRVQPAPAHALSIIGHGKN